MFAFPTPYSRGNCTRASYALKPNGHIEVYNRGFQGDQEFSVVGDAFVADPNEPGLYKKLNQRLTIHVSDYTGAKFYYQMPFISSSELCPRL